MHLFRKRMVPEGGAGSRASPAACPFAATPASSDDIVLFHNNSDRSSVNRKLTAAPVCAAQAPPSVLPAPALSSHWVAAQQAQGVRPGSDLHEHRAGASRIGANFPGLRNVGPMSTPKVPTQTLNDQAVEEDEDNDDGSSVDTIGDTSDGADAGAGVVTNKIKGRDRPQQQQNNLVLLALCVTGEELAPSHREDCLKEMSAPATPEMSRKKKKKKDMSRRRAVEARTWAKPVRGCSSSPIDISADEVGGRTTEKPCNDTPSEERKTLSITQGGSKRAFDDQKTEEREAKASSPKMLQKELNTNKTPPLKEDGGDRHMADTYWAQKMDRDRFVAACLQQKNQAALSAAYPFAIGAGLHPMHPAPFGSSLLHPSCDNATLAPTSKRRRLYQDYTSPFAHHSLEDNYTFSRNDQAVINPLYLTTPKSDSMRFLQEAMLRHQQQVSVTGIADSRHHSHLLTPPVVPSSQDGGLSMTPVMATEKYLLGTGSAAKTAGLRGDNPDRNLKQSTAPQQAPHDREEGSWKSKYEGLCLSKPSAGGPAVSSWLFKQPPTTNTKGPNDSVPERCASPSASSGSFDSFPCLTSSRQGMEQNMLTSSKAPSHISVPGVFSSACPETSTGSLSSAARNIAIRSEQRLGGINIQEINQHDVLLGRGGHSIGHAGNKRMREVIVDLLPCFLGGTTVSKARVVDRVVRNVYAHGGRFLERKRDEAGRDVWRIIPHMQSREKVKQRFREEASGRAKRHPSGGKNRRNF